MQTALHHWKIFDARTPILTCAYSFGPGLATALAVGAENGLIIASPPYRISESAFDDLRAYGPVGALVATNAYHYLGIPEWKRRFPDALVFAPAQSIVRVTRQTKIEDIRPVAQAGAVTGGAVDLVDIPHFRTGEVLVRIDTQGGRVWYVTDVILNLSELPPQAILKALFKLSGSAPGLRFNNIAPIFMAKDKGAVRRWLAAEFEKDRPRWLIPAHGDIVDLKATPDAARSLFQMR